MSRTSFAVSLALVVTATVPAWAQALPPGCQSAGAEAPGIPLQLDLSSLPGAAGRTATGSTFVMIPGGPSGNCAAQHPHLPRDVLRGDPGDALHGEDSPDLLRGPPTGRVEYGPVGQPLPVR